MKELLNTAYTGCDKKVIPCCICRTLSIDLKLSYGTLSEICLRASEKTTGESLTSLAGKVHRPFVDVPLRNVS